MDHTNIEWTDATWNPIRGCSRVSAGCENCYAERVAARFSGPGMPYEGLATMGESGPRWTRQVALVRSKLDVPLRWRKPRRIFVNSMSDLFHEGLADEQIAAVFGIMAAAPQHTFQVLTKRAERMYKWFVWACSRMATPTALMQQNAADALAGDLVGEERDALLQRSGILKTSPVTTPWPLPNVWLGVSAEDQGSAIARIPHLLKTPASIRFVSYEPALGPVSFMRYLRATAMPGRCIDIDGDWWHKPGSCGYCLPRLDWVIAGAENGPGARPMREDWVRTVRDDCARTGVSFFYKQRIDEDSGSGSRKVALPVLDGRQHVEWPTPPPVKKLDDLEETQP